MNNTFDIRRFGNYFVSELRAAVSNFGITIGILSAMPVILYLFAGVFSVIFFGHWGASPLAARIPFFAVSIIVLLIAQPVSCYGKITQKQYGSSYALLPVSVLEKTLSMILICCLITPLCVVAVHCSLDALLCAIDSRCGESLVSLVGSLSSADFVQDALSELKAYDFDIAAFLSPLLYVDDIIQTSLLFLLGALMFKNNKVVKTILALILFSMVSSMILSPIMIGTGKNLMETDDPTIILNRFGWMFKNMALLDTINDTLVNLGLAVAVFFRIKTIKH